MIAPICYNTTIPYNTVIRPMETHPKTMFIKYFNLNIFEPHKWKNKCLETPTNGYLAVDWKVDSLWSPPNDWVHVIFSYKLSIWLRHGPVVGTSFQMPTQNISSQWCSLVKSGGWNHRSKHLAVPQGPSGFCHVFRVQRIQQQEFFLKSRFSLTVFFHHLNNMSCPNETNLNK